MTGWEDGFALPTDAQTPMRPNAKKRKKKPRAGLRFAALAAGILLAGALAAGLAARAVVAPRAGLQAEQPTPDIPTVLGQTAEELRFSPWPLYDILEKDRVAAIEGLGDDFPGLLGPKEEGGFFACCGNAVGAALSEEERHGLWERLEYPADGSSALFLHDAPIRLEDGTPVLLQFASAYSSAGGGFSLLAEPAVPKSQSTQRQAEALERVRQDLKSYLMLGEETAFVPLLRLLMSRNYFADTPELYEMAAQMLKLPPEDVQTMTEVPLVTSYEMGERVWQLAAFLQEGRWLAQELAFGTGPAGAEAAEGTGPAEKALSEDAGPEQSAGSGAGQQALAEGIRQVELEEFLAEAERKGLYSVQLITTPGEVVVLLGQNETVFGLYYDIQLGRYSGIGMQNE